MTNQSLKSILGKSFKMKMKLKILVKSNDEDFEKKIKEKFLRKKK